MDQGQTISKQTILQSLNKTYVNLEGVINPAVISERKKEKQYKNLGFYDPLRIEREMEGNFYENCLDEIKNDNGRILKSFIRQLSTDQIGSPLRGRRKALPFVIQGNSNGYDSFRDLDSSVQ